MNKSLQEISEAYESLKESENRYKRLVEGAPDISYIYGTKTGAKFWSSQVETILGISPAELVKDPFAWFNAIHPDDLTRVNALFRTLNKNKNFSIEYRIKDRQGKWHWLNDRTISIKKIRGEYLIEGLAQDITEKKLMEEKLRASEEIFRKAFITSPDSININRLEDGLYVTINKGFTKILGYEEKDVIGKTSLELNIWQNEEDRNKLVKELKKNGRIENFESSFVNKHGNVVYGLMSAVKIDLEGTPHILSITRDITERKKLTHKILKNQFYLEKAQELGMIGTWEIDLSDNSLIWTDECYHIFDVPLNSPMNLAKLITLSHPEDKDHILQHWNNALQGAQYDIEHRIIAHNTVKWVREKADVVFDKDGKAKSAIGFVQDITARKLQESEVKEKQNLLNKVESISKIGGWEIDLTKDMAYWTKGIYDIVEMDYNDPVPGLSEHVEYYLPEYRKMIKQKFDELISTGKAIQFEAQLLTHKNNIKWCKIIGEATNTKGKITKLNGTFQDISERKDFEKALRDSEEKYRLIVERANDGIEISQNDKIIYSNKRFAEILGYSLEEMKGLSFNEIFSDESKEDLINRQILRNKSDERQNQYEATFIRKDGKLINVSVNYQIIDFNNKPATFAIIRDITESKKMEKELRKLSTAVEQSPSVIAITDISGKLEYVNPKFIELTGYQMQEIMGKTPRILKSGVLPDNVYNELWSTILSGNTWRGEFHNKKKNGEMYWENAAITPVLDSDGKTIHFLKVAEDITEWKEIEDALRLSEEKYRLIVENANDGIIISQKDQFIYSNNRFAQMLGYNVEELNNISFKEIYTKEATKSLYDRHNKREKGEFVPNHYETTFKKKDGNIIIVDVNYQIIEFQEEEATFAIIRDITDQKHANEALKEALKKAKESDHLKSAFLANMSHEIRTPMNGIMGFARLLRNKDISGEKQEQYLDVIEKSSERMLNIINDLIDISKIESGQMELHSQKFSINEMITFIQNFFDPECNSKGIELIASSSLPPEEAIIVSDKNKLEAIMINLLKNAIKFTHHGHIKFGYEQYEDVLMFYVEDTGIGIPENKQKQIFDRFIQADSSMTKPYEGAGLGLSISKAFVEMLGGTLELRSKVNSGSRFYFSIPFIKFNNGDAQSFSSDEKEPDKPFNLSKHNLKVIIAEDDEPSFLYLNILMQPFCRTIIHARNGAECVELCKKHKDVDLILMDVKMPIMGGYDATKAIRVFNRDVIIFAQTAYALSDDQNKILESGCNDYISKPIQESNLGALIDKYFSK